MYPWHAELAETSDTAVSLMKREQLKAMRESSGHAEKEEEDEEKMKQDTTVSATRMQRCFVPIDRVFSILQHNIMADSDARQQRRERSDGGVRIADLRRWTLRSPDREAGACYSPAPSDILLERAFGGTSSTSTHLPPSSSSSSAAAAGRQGREGAERHGKRHRSAGEGPMMHGKREETEVESPFLLEPSMRFVDGFQSIDYMGRLFIHPLPSALQAAAVRQSEPCAPPRAPRRVLQAPVSRRGTETTQVSSGSAPTAAGVQLVRWAPPTFGHLLFSADLQGVAKLWQCHPSGGPSGSPTSGKGKISSSHSSLIATFNAHNRPIKSLQVTSDASILTTGSTDGTITMWDVETGQCLHQMWCNEPSLYHELSRGQAGRGQRDGAVLPVVDHLHHPSDERHILLAAVDRKVLLYDVRTPSHQLSSSSSSITATGMTKGAAGAGDSSGYGGCASFKPLREYMGHMGTILHLSLLGSSGSKMLTTSEDKTLRTWDYAIPIQIKQFADAGMHAISHVMAHPYEKDVLAAQSLNNKVIVFQDEGGGRLRLWQHREFTGHKIAGTGCQLGFSRDGSMLSSGDIHGNLFLWKWSNGELVKKFMAHSEMLTSHVWHPIDGSRIVTAGWDGAIKEWT